MLIRWLFALLGDHYEHTDVDGLLISGDGTRAREIDSRSLGHDEATT